MLHYKKALFVLFTIPILAACSSNTSNQPVYQGMTVISSIREPIQKLEKIQNQIDDHDPFGDQDLGTIRDVISSTYPIINAEKNLDYYANKDSWIFINVNLDNPTNFVILSFILNETFYQSYQFQEGSDSENLILRVNTGSVSGIKSFTIDAIKYVDGNSIKDVVFAADRTIEVGISEQQIPEISYETNAISYDSISLSVNFTDNLSISSWTKAILYDGRTIMKEVDVIKGSSTVNFQPLLTNTMYQVAFIGQYDALQGKTISTHLFDSFVFYTQNIIDIVNVVPDKRKIEFDVQIQSLNQTGSIESMSISSNGAVVQTLIDFETSVFNDLMSNSDYTIKVEYRFSLPNGLGLQTTKAYYETRTLYMFLDTNTYSLVGTHNGWNVGDSTYDLKRLDVEGNDFSITFDSYKNFSWLIVINRDWNYPAIAPNKENMTLFENGTPWDELPNAEGTYIGKEDTGFNINFKTKVDGRYTINLTRVDETHYQIFYFYDGLPLVPAEETVFKLVGTFNNWNPDTSNRVYIFTKLNDRDYEITISLNEGDQFKVVGMTSIWANWFGATNDNYTSVIDNAISHNPHTSGDNFIVNLSGTYIISMTIGLDSNDFQFEMLSPQTPS
jgi:hypothetical protein